MEKIVNYFTCNYENDTTIEYVSTGHYSALNCLYTSECPDFGTETIHFISRRGVKPMDQMAYEMGNEVRSVLNYYNGNVDEQPQWIGDYVGFCTSTMIAVERALYKLSKSYRPDKRYATVADAARWIVSVWREDGEKTFGFCESNIDESKGDPAEHEDAGGWYGIKKIKGFFDNDPSDFIATVGFWGGGNMSLAYVFYEDADDSNCEQSLCEAICEATGLDTNDMIYIEIDEQKKEDK